MLNLFNARSLSGQAKGIDADALAAAIKLVDEKEAVANAAQVDQDKAVKDAADAQSAFDKFKSDNPSVKDEPNPTDEPSKNYQKLKNASLKADADAVLAKAENTKRQANLTDAKALRTAASTAGKSGSINAVISSDPAQKSLEAANVEKVAAAVSKIVEDTLNLGFGREVCTTLFGQIAAGKTSDLTKEPGKALVESCIRNLDQNADSSKAESELIRAEAKQVTTTSGLIDEITNKLKEGKTVTAKFAKFLTLLPELQKSLPNVKPYAPMFNLPNPSIKK